MKWGNDSDSGKEYEQEAENRTGHDVLLKLKSSEPNTVYTLCIG